MGRWFVDHFRLDVAYRVVEMEGWRPRCEAPGYGWPRERVWINPSPNAANVNMARAYAGTVMLEGTTLSEGRGTTRPLELFGAPDVDARAVMRGAARAGAASGWRAARCGISGSSRRSTSMSGQLVRRGVHPRGGRGLRSMPPSARGGCRRWRSRRSGGCGPDYPLWRDFPYEYDFGKLAIDVINGGPGACANGSMTRRRWPATSTLLTVPDERAWEAERTRVPAVLSWLSSAPLP
ncbi:MAG: DUF1343 domain-containing protein [Candidatus Sphingomonas colombiensis]|nr:exo-beta-N-acetylmuramidase NamZ domain-containing protein [Sphingomonas sp.]WEK44917.1 MAG: DUF1343 domain-containing protein [Sphingomonas sp.]